MCRVLCIVCLSIRCLSLRLPRKFPQVIADLFQESGRCIGRWSSSGRTPQKRPRARKGRSLGAFAGRLSNNSSRIQFLGSQQSTYLSASTEDLREVEKWVGHRPDGGAVALGRAGEARNPGPGIAGALILAVPGFHEFRPVLTP
jgi:hypothetical protein